MKQPAQTPAQSTEKQPVSTPHPRLLAPSIACLLCTLASFLLMNSYSYNTIDLLDPLFGMLFVLIFPITFALGLFLIYSLLELIILHHAFRPAHLLSLPVIVSSTAILFPFFILQYLLFYLIIAIVIAVILSLRKSFPAIAFSIANIILALIILITLALHAFDLPSNYSITITLYNISTIFILPLTLALTFINFQRLNFLSLTRPFKLLIYTGFLLTFIAFVGFLADAEASISSEPIPSSTCCGHYPD